MNYQLIHEVIDQVADFQKENQSGSMQDFSAWLSQKIENEKKIANQEKRQKKNVDKLKDSFQDSDNHFQNNEEDFKEQENYSVLALITYLYRYAKLYAKKALEEHQSAFVTFDELVYLITLYFNPSPLSKTQLIETNIHEKPTGMEIIKRLLRNGLIAQFDSKEDKRIKYLRVTQKGEAEFMKVFGTMRAIAQLVSGNLTKEEDYQLFQLLKKLHLFHNPIFLHEKEKPLQEILGNYGSFDFLV